MKFRIYYRILPVDLNDPGATRQVTKKAVAFFGKIDILVNNAGEFINLLDKEIQLWLVFYVSAVKWYCAI